MAHIEVTINPDGTTQIEAHGYTGTACLDATRPIEAALGVPAARRTKREMTQTTKATAGRAK